MAEWPEIAQRLVEIDLAIEDRASWATTPDDVEELRELERARDELQAALLEHRIPSKLREHFELRSRGAAAPSVDPRD